MTPVSLSIVRAPVVVSDASALKKLPPAITVPDVFVVLETSKDAADVVCPEKTAPNVEFSVIPAKICANPVCVTEGVNDSLDNIATLVLPAYIDETTLFPPELANVSIFQPDNVCPDAYTGPANNHAEPVYKYN